ncbi:MAG: SDR family oxidoreductase [Chloroflexi bacterium]|nr:SDR family oxidoreductase [Chloroflexota bacterium]
MRLLVLGATGMLGHRICRLLGERFEVWGAIRGEMHGFERYNFISQKQIIEHVDAQNLSTFRNALELVKPDAVINGIGIVKQRDEAKQAVPSIHVNALFPHQLADLCADNGVRVLQISTDCVFSGARGNYTEIDTPDPIDLYGRTKLLGELNRPGTLTLRTSIIGWQLNTYSSLLGWLASQRGHRIKGYRHAIYSGFSTTVLSNLIGDILETRKDLTGLYHVSSAPISKFDLLTRLRDALGWTDITINPDDQFYCDRSLVGTRFSKITGWMPPSWDEMIEGLASEWPMYEHWNKN